MIDTSRCIFLGVVPRFLEAAIWLCIVSNVWQVDATRTATRDQLCIQRCRAEFFDWYHRKARTNGARVTELTDLTPGMLGTRGSPFFPPKGAEARWLLPFCERALGETQSFATCYSHFHDRVWLHPRSADRDDVRVPSKAVAGAVQGELGTRGADIKRKRWPRKSNLVVCCCLCAVKTARRQV